MWDELADALRARGIDVLTARDANRRRLSDPEQLTFATESGRTIYTRNRRHFQALHTEYMRTGRSHGGIVVRPSYDLSVGTALRALLALNDAHTPASMQDRLEFLTDWLADE